MRAPELIRKKRDGHALTSAEIQFFIAGFTHGGVTDYQMSAMAMAIYFQGLDDDELSAWTHAMLHSGTVLELESPPGPRVDKHSTGGVGDKTTFILAPIAASAGLCLPMVSGRGLGHTGGTLDKLESIPGFDVAPSTERFKTIVETHGLAIIGQTDEIAPADRKLYALRDVTATVSCIPLIASSIMSKKLAEGLEGLVLDIKVGSGAFMREADGARELAHKMVAIGEQMGVTTRVLLTNMDQPLGNTVGNALELREAVDVLRGGGPNDLRRLSCELAAEMMHVGGIVESVEAGRVRAEELIASGAAFERFAQVVEAQGGDRRVIEDPSLLPHAPIEGTMFAPQDGFVTGFHCEAVGLAAMHLGAGRAVAADTIDHGVGLVLHKKIGDAVTRGEPVVTIHANSTEDVALAIETLGGAIRFDEERITPPRLVQDRIKA